jgi:HSP20 family protein
MLNVQEVIMGNIVRFSPFQPERFSPFEQMERMLRDMDERMRSLIGDGESLAGNPLDVSEDDQANTDKADLPGVAKDDIQVAIDGEHVSITAEVKRQSDEHAGNVLCCERYCGQQYRSFSVDHAIDDSRASAKYENGVLELTLPKKAGVTSQRRLLTIH